jgi:hypothetical protein
MDTTLWGGRSVVFPAGAPVGQAGQADASSQLGEAAPWYLDRNDYARGVEQGTRGPTYEVAVTSSRLRSSYHRGQVHDSYHSTTYRRQVTSVSR